LNWGVETRRRKPHMARRRILTNVVSESFLQPTQQIAAQNASIADLAALPDQSALCCLRRVRPSNEAYPQRSKPRHSSRAAVFVCPLCGEAETMRVSPASIANGPPDRSATQVTFVTRLQPSGYPAKPLVSYRTNRQLSGWIPPPLRIRAFWGAPPAADSRAGSKRARIRRSPRQFQCPTERFVATRPPGNF